MATGLILEQSDFLPDRPVVLQKIALFKKKRGKGKIKLTPNPDTLIVCDMLLRLGVRKKASVHIAFMICIQTFSLMAKTAL